MNDEYSSFPAPFEKNRPAQNFLIIIGMYLLGYALSNVIGLICLVWIGHKSVFELAQLDFTDHNILVATYVGQILGVFFAFIGPSLLFVHFVTKQRLEYIKIKHSGKIVMILLAGVIMVCANPIIDYLADLNSKFPFPDIIKKLEDAASKEEQAFLMNQSFRKFLMNIFMIGALAAFGEELFFRAVLQQTIIKWTKNVHAGVWITGIIFSALHLEFYGFLPRMLMGVYLGYLFVWSGSLWVSMFAHFINNSLIVVLIYFNPSLVTADKMNLGTQSQQMLYLGLSVLVVTLLLIPVYWMRQKSQAVVG